MKVIEFQKNLIYKLEHNPMQKEFEFTRDTKEYHFLNIFMQREIGAQERIPNRGTSIGTIDLIWKSSVDDITIKKYRLMNTYYIYIDRDNIVKIINRLIDNHNSDLDNRWGKMALHVDHYIDLHRSMIIDLIK